MFWQFLTKCAFIHFYIEKIFSRLDGEIKEVNMKHPIFCLSFLFACNLIADEIPPDQVTPELVAAQLKDAEAEYNEAKENFNFWYAGPLLTPGAHILPPGQFILQPYLFFTNNYAKFSQSGSSKSINSLNQLNPSAVFQFGMLKWLDGVINLQSLTNWQNGNSSTHFGDMSFSLGVRVVDEHLYSPAILISIKETFPTGKYSNLNPSLDGIDASGAGAYSTSVNLNIAKVIWWIPKHPMNVRASFGYTFSTVARVTNYNAYGGGIGTKGNIHTPYVFSADAALEYSFSKRWVFALDAVYNYATKTHFVGQSGVDIDGNPASNGGPFNDNLSFAPAIEYNFSPDLGVIAGVWFSVWGRNSLDFVSGIVSVTWGF